MLVVEMTRQDETQLVSKGKEENKAIIKSSGTGLAMFLVLS
jgi:hypothetical protein